MCVCVRERLMCLCSLLCETTAPNEFVQLQVCGANDESCCDIVVGVCVGMSAAHENIVEVLSSAHQVLRISPC